MSYNCKIIRNIQELNIFNAKQSDVLHAKIIKKSDLYQKKTYFFFLDLIDSYNNKISMFVVGLFAEKVYYKIKVSDSYKITNYLIEYKKKKYQLKSTKFTTFKKIKHIPSFKIVKNKLFINNVKENNQTCITNWFKKKEKN